MVCWQQAKMLYKYRGSLHTRMRTHTPPDEQNQSSGTAELRLSIPACPAGNSDHPLGWTPRPPRPVCPVLRPHRPCRTLRPPPGQDSPSPRGGVPESTSPQARQDTPTNPWTGLPSEAVHCGSSTAHCPRAVRQCIAGVALPTAPRQWGRALQEFQCPLPPGSEAVHCRSGTAYCPRVVRRCIAGVALPTAPSQ